VYYKVFAHRYTEGLEKSPFKLGAKGTLDGIEYEIIGRIRYQDEEEWEVDVWDEWLAVTSEGTYHWFVEEDGTIYAYEEYVPSSMNLDAEGNKFEFEGKLYSKKSTGFVARIVYAEGELTWKPEIGEPMQCYDFHVGKNHYTIEQSEDEVSVTKGKRIPLRKIIMAFCKEEYFEKYERTMLKRALYKRKARVYGIASLIAIVLIIYGCSSGHPIAGAFDRSTLRVLAANQPKFEEGTNAFYSQVLYTKGVKLDRTNSLYQLRLEIDERIQPLRQEWVSCRFFLINEKQYLALLEQEKSKLASEQVSSDSGIPPKPDDVISSPLSDILDEIDAMPEPLESFSHGGDFWHEEGYDDEGHWQESEMLVEKDFVIDEPGTYYAYLELFSQNPRNVESIRVSILEDVKSYRYYVMALGVMLILWLINKVKSNTYNELPFPVSGEYNEE
ncbi:MAG: DUF4178 domain-containing protein, partial [Spirochaetes bacterium]|nr:DUF4178 domain-containing protein [Spirochaetota bacterium]